MRLAFVAAALIAFPGPIALAQTGSEVIARTPKKIYEFVPYCTSHLNDCRSMVDLVANELLSEGERRKADGPRPSHVVPPCAAPKSPMDVAALQLNFMFIHQLAIRPFDENGFVMRRSLLTGKF